MALIICPECNGKVSDQATSCPHCGFPFNNNANVQKNKNICLINNKEIDLLEVMQFISQNRQSPRVAFLVMNLTDCNMTEARDLCDIIKVTGKIPATFTMEKDPMPRDKPFDISGSKNNQIKCPKCGSTQIQMVARKWSLMTGLLTNKVDRVCMNCKCKF